MRAAGLPEARPAATAALKIGWLTRRADYLALQDRERPKSTRWSTPFFTIQTRLHETALPFAWQVGFTASRRVGNSVVRSRAKRRLRELVRNHLARVARPGFDLVLVGRTSVAIAPFPLLIAQLEEAVRRLKLEKIT